MTQALELRATRPSRPATVGDLSVFLADALGRPAPAGRVRSYVLPLPAGVERPAQAALRSLRGTDAFYLHDRASGLEVLGLGCTLRAAPTGPGRFEAVRSTTRRWLSEAAVVHHPEAPRTPLSCFVGFAFSPGAARAEPWEPFGDALAVLPRWLLVDGVAERALVLCLAGPTPTDLVIAELHELLGASARRPARSTSVSVAHEPPEEHAARVRSALSEIEEGRLDKVVVSRRSVITSDVDLDPSLALERLEASAARTSTLYFVRRAGSVLTGATPERLLSMRGTSLETEALAGTARDATLLRGSAKDRAEHQFVIDSIRASLSPFATEVRIGASDVSAAGSVLHLRTPVAASLRPGIHPLEVAAALHPTSAVAGTPEREATAWIERTEPGRGWYTGLVGWVDQHDGAELFVALRGGVIRGARAWAFSGGGIVAGSVPAAEHEETELKMSAFLQALGAPA
jgi:menaquinone-specific isochorismate synthase